MQRGVHGRLMDNSTSVREAAVELLGRFVLCRPQLAEQYYDMLIERILVWWLVILMISGMKNLVLTDLCFIIWNDDPKSELYLTVLMGSIMLLRSAL